MPTVSELLDGHVTLEVECRPYLFERVRWGLGCGGGGDQVEIDLEETAERREGFRAVAQSRRNALAWLGAPPLETIAFIVDHERTAFEHAHLEASTLVRPMSGIVIGDVSLWNRRKRSRKRNLMQQPDLPAEGVREHS